MSGWQTYKALRAERDGLKKDREALLAAVKEVVKLASVKPTRADIVEMAATVVAKIAGGVE